jgi:hypothetical protein
MRLVRRIVADGPLQAQERKGIAQIEADLDSGALARFVRVGGAGA